MEQETMDTQYIETPDMPEVLSNRYLTVTQFADLFGITKSGVYNMIYRGTLKSIKFGSMTLIDRREVSKFKPVMKNKLLRLERHDKKQKRGRPKGKGKKVPEN